MMRSSSHALPLGVLTALLLAQLCSGIKWLTLSNSPIAPHLNSSEQCKLLPNLVPTQIQLCRTHVDIMKTIAQAAREVKKTCQKTFSDMRWNCSSIEISPDAPKYRPDLDRGTREAAFVYALSTATIIHSISRACGLGYLKSCSCARRPDEAPGPDFRWGGCGDNMVFGTPLGTKFAEASLKLKRSGSHASKLMHLHNSEVGKQVLRKSVVLKCKCHGVSGSCSVKSCWKAFQDLKEIAMDLKSRYLSATKVIHRPMGITKKLVPKDIDIRPVRDNELVYLHSSPDFCTKNEKLGSVGTQDRQCNKTSVGSDSCDLMCCGRGYNPYTEKLVERCHCKYHWCCYVTCKKCERTVERYVCK